MVSHENLGAEARALLDVLSQRLEQAAATGGPSAEPHSPRCTSCPICAALAYLREHRELSGQLAQGALLIVGALRQYLDQPATAGAAPNSVQHIDIT